MDFIKTNILASTYRKIKNNLPPFIYASTIKLIPLFLISSVFEIIGLAIIIPVINLLVDTTKIQSNSSFQHLYDIGSFKNNVSFVLFLLFLIGIVFLFKNILLFFITRHQAKTGFNIASRLSTSKYNTYLKKPYLFFSENSSAILLRNVVQLPIDLVTYIIIPFIGLLNESFLILLIIGVMIWYNSLLFFATFIFTMPFFLLYSVVYKKRLKKLSNIRDEGSSAIYKIGLQSIDGHREISVFDKLDFFKSKYQKAMQSYSKGLASEYLLNVFSPKLVETVAILCLVNIFLFGYFFEENIIVLTQFLAAFAIASYRIIPSVNKIILYSNYIKSCSYIFNHFSKDDTDSPTGATSQLSSSGIKFTDKLEIKKLSFKYDTDTQYTLRNISLSIPKGQAIGIIGPSGSGKTTLLNILLRLLNESEGGIFVDGVKISVENIKDWYKLVSYVPQNMTLIEGSIRENIAFGVEKKDIKEELMLTSIEKAQLATYVSSLPNGLDTFVGEKGVNISGGQKQRIAIARALYHGGKILIFDEATSALDSTTEEMLTESIHSIAHKELTIIIVSHKHQTLKYCDYIYKLNNGLLESPVSYNELIS